MGNIIDIQSKSAGLRTEKQYISTQLHLIRARLESIHKKLDALKHAGIPESDPQITVLKRDLGAMVSQKADLLTRFAINTNHLKDLTSKIQKEYDPIKDAAQLDDSYPIFLFPVRLETRFKQEGNQHQLWLRVYPDDCNVVMKEPLLSEAELENVKLFYCEMAKAGKVESEERGAWRVLVNNHGANRSAWMIDQYKPLSSLIAKPEPSYKILVLLDEKGDIGDLSLEGKTFWKETWLAQENRMALEAAETKLRNSGLPDDAISKTLEAFVPYNLADVIEKDFDPNKIIIFTLKLPKPDTFTTTQTSWNTAPHAVSLPDRFVALTYTGNDKTTHVFEHAVKEHLPMGLDPSLDEGQIDKDLEGIHLAEELRWMVDFDEALKAGMATKINIAQAESQNGFDKLFVLGLRISANPETSKGELEDLITAHAQSKQGFEFIRQGTPTNNTEDNPSAYSWIENADESFDRIFKGSELFTYNDDIKNQSDAQRLADSLGIDASILQGLPHANGRDMLEAHAMNTALFPATLGYFMEEMMDPLFSDGDIADTKRFFANYVSGRGPIPAIKIGSQPYGILPVTNFSRLSFQSLRLSAKNNYISRLYALINKMDETWDSLLPQVNYIGKKGDPHQILLDVLGLHANSVEFHQRYAQSVQQIYNQANLKTKNPAFASLIAKTIKQRSIKILQELGIYSEKTKLPILEKYFLSKPNVLKGPLVDDVPESEIQPIRPYSVDGKNYIEWLQSSNGNQIRLQNFGGNDEPNALLYLLLRHSLLLAQASSATNLMLNSGMIRSKNTFHDTDFLYIQDQDIAKSKFEHLYKPNEIITGNKTLNLIEYIYEPTALANLAETEGLQQVLQSLKVLEKTPTARLERLLIEHLDNCSYRIDSWKTGINYYQLKEQQKQLQQSEKQAGIHLGAYGWLLDLRPKQQSVTEKQIDQQDQAFFAAHGEKIYIDSENLGYIHAPSIDQAATAAILRNAYDANKESGSKNPFNINLSSERVRIAKDFLEGLRNGQSLAALLGYQFERGLHDRYDSSNIEADKFIYPLRMAFPLLANNLKSTQISSADLQEANESNKQSDTGIEAIEARQVIDGLKLIQHVQKLANKAYPFGKSNLPTASPAESQALSDEVNRLIATQDAIADLLMSEQVYQAVKGNFERAASVAEAFSQGAYPPEMEVVNTERTGTTLNHKIAIHFDSEASPLISPNTLSSMTNRAAAEPAVNKWLSTILPSPQNVQVKVKIEEPGKPQKIAFLSQKDLGLQPIDLLFSASFEDEQAMTELDDRITNYLIYHYVDNAGHKTHPFAKLSILYTAEIDRTDKSKVSFFELASILRSLKKLFVNKAHLSKTSFQLPTDTSDNSAASFDIPELSTRINKLEADLTNQKNSLSTFRSQIISIRQLCKKHEVELKAAHVDVEVIEELNKNLSQDIKSYFHNRTASTKAELLDNYAETLDNLAIHATTKDLLLAAYDNYLSSYAADFINLSQLIQQSAEKFMRVALFDNNLTGTGFMQQAIAGIFNSVIQKVEVVVARWDKRSTEYDTILTDYPLATTDARRIEILQLAERKITAANTYPIPDNPVAFKMSVETIKDEFDAILGDLKAIESIAYRDVNDFIEQTTTTLEKLARFDLVFFDTDTNRNDLYSELQQLILLKEDIDAAVENLIENSLQKITNFHQEMAAVHEVKSDSAQVELFLNACKKLLKEEIILVPKLNLSAEVGDLIKSSFDNSESIQQFAKDFDNREFPVDEWLSGVARVRSHAWEWENIASLSQGFNPNKTLELTPLQFPHQDNARWLALKFVKNAEDQGYDETEEKEYQNTSGDKLLYTAHFATTFEQSKALCGIILDEWTEVIPNQEETTGIAFHYDQPNSEPPQTMLLVSPSALNGQWQWDDLVGALEETLTMAKKRAVEPSMVDHSKFGQFLPTTLMAVTSHLITVAMNLSINNLNQVKK